MPKLNHHPNPSLEETREAEALVAIAALAPIADRWGYRILREVFAGVHRYGELQRRLGISRNILADRLSKLVDAELLRRVPYRIDPAWYEYRLTQRAADFYPTIIAFYEWVDTHFSDSGIAVFEQRPHSCGLHGRPILICSACREAITIDPDEIVE